MLGNEQWKKKKTKKQNPTTVVPQPDAQALYQAFLLRQLHRWMRPRSELHVTTSLGGPDLPVQAEPAPGSS